MESQNYFENDKEIRGQKYCCLSFVSPEDVIKKKEVYFFEKFMGNFSKDMNELFDNLVAKYPNDVDQISGIKDRYEHIFKPESINDEYSFYVKANGEKLENEYLVENNFQTSMRALKVRGSYETMEEAQMQAKRLVQQDKMFNVYVAQVGCWCPWDPNPEGIDSVEYANEQLNTLIGKYKETSAKKDEYENLRKIEMMKRKAPIIIEDPTEEQLASSSE